MEGERKKIIMRNINIKLRYIQIIIKMKLDEVIILRNLQKNITVVRLVISIMIKVKIGLKKRIIKEKKIDMKIKAIKIQNV